MTSRISRGYPQNGLRVPEAAVPYLCSSDIPGSCRVRSSVNSSLGRHRRAGSGEPARKRSMTGATQGALIILYSPSFLSSCNFVIYSVPCMKIKHLYMHNEILNWQWRTRERWYVIGSRGFRRGWGRGLTYGGFPIYNVNDFLCVGLVLRLLWRQEREGKGRWSDGWACSWEVVW